MAKKTVEIAVEDKLRALYDLQIIDSRLDEIRSTRGELPIEVEDLEIEIEGLDKRSEKFQSEIKLQNDEINTKNENLVSETQKEEDFLIEKSKEFAKKIDERLLASYQRIRTNSPNGLAVVGLERGAPKGSFFTLPPQKQMEIAQRKKIIIDEHSGKILVDDDMVNEENEKMKDIIKF